VHLVGGLLLLLTEAVGCLHFIDGIDLDLVGRLVAFDRLDVHPLSKTLVEAWFDFILFE
jgi:hypothetical protein